MPGAMNVAEQKSSMYACVCMCVRGCEYMFI